MTPEQLAYPAQNSIELTLTAKGLYTWTIKQYHHADQESTERAAVNLAHIDQALRKAFPHPEAGA